MPIKEFKLLFRDIGFYISGRSDVTSAAWKVDPWLYPLDWKYQLDREADYFFPKDAVGIPLREYSGSLGRQYLISRIAAYALAHWNRWRTEGHASNRSEFLRTVEWFPAAPGGRYEHQFPVAGMQSPWISCISQGEAASVFCRAFVETGKANYLSQAIAAIGPLMTPVEEGGLQSRLPDGRPFLEEYPKTAYRHVLNGCLYATVGIYDVMRATSGSNSSHTQLFHGLIDAIAENLSAWDTNGWSTYDYPFKTGVPRNANTMTYQVLQAVLLRYLGEATSDERLLATAFRWETSTSHLAKRLVALYRKVQYRISSRW